ncbi:cation:dicarboxylase symporter family transporter [Campylobacter sp. RM12327]|uniref:cation:dicarboxylate symporter family transporter n=1 Tax=Campylobacter sputorum TaxID=206 RepID=UPI000B76CA67|nr:MULTISPECIES: cation:dicarboxylase symporter family transporter [Campylobacter]ASM40192.1 sodium/dicarboxylate symporter family protein [Campylobacter sputorum]MBE7358651.1 cation:dicarboxylase symporter family transporter [Campylobacter sp. RM11302]MBF6669958.1 cation:dicarboxylase symporter family transporter [Campylobacter sp. RM12327]MBF6675130.1 cation:dicarboxylase symporter family transporter [Campylobacter sp. RM13538]MBF6676448.1 cation:dicarboxylase symporter family transporter [C
MYSFFVNFFNISSIYTLLGLFALALIFYLLKVLKNVGVSNGKIMALSLIFGILLGYLCLYLANFPHQNILSLKDSTNLRPLYEIYVWFKFIIVMFISFLKLLIIPIIFFGIIRVIINLDQNVKFKNIFGISFSYLMITTAIASLIGITLAIVMQVGSGTINQTTTKIIKEVKPINEVILDFIPNNIISAMANTNVLGVVIFSLFIAFGANMIAKNEDIKNFEILRNLIDFIYKIIMQITKKVISFLPYVVVVMIANTFLENGFDAIISALDYIVLCYVAAILTLSMHAIVLLINGLNPIKYFQKALPTLIMAFTSRSSSGTLPMTISTLTNKFGVSSSNASFVASISTTIGMNGCAGFYTGSAAVFLLNALGVSITFEYIAMIVILSVIASFGIAGIPGIAIMALSVVITGLGLENNFALLATILAIDPIIDMARTATNVSGGMTASIATDKVLKTLSKDVYNS